MMLLVFEDEAASNFNPLTYMRPVYELKCGAYTLLDRLLASVPSVRALLTCRPYLAPLLRRARPQFKVNEPASIDDDVLLINGRALLTKVGLAELAVNRTCWVKDGSLAACTLKVHEARELWDLVLNGRSSELVNRLRERGFKLREAPGLDLLKGPWDLVRLTPELLSIDLSNMPRGGGVVEDGVVVKGGMEGLIVEEGAVVEALSIIDVRQGPVFIGRGSVVEGGSRIVGPAYLGSNVVVKGAYIREGCVIGDHCRLGGGGEVEASIMHGYVNKYHLGFLGHAYVGEWVNLAAATTNSDLKNTYGTVKVSTPSGRTDTGMLKLGCFIGDHVKTSIGTMIYTGVKIGVCSHVHGFVTRDVPSFTIWAESLGRRPVELRVESVIEAARRVKARRGVELSSDEVEVIKSVFEATAKERLEAGVVKGEFRL